MCITEKKLQLNVATRKKKITKKIVGDDKKK